LCFLDWAIKDDESPEPKRVDEIFMSAACCLVCDYLWPHSRAALRQIGLSERRHANLRRVLRWIKATGKTEISIKDIRRDMFLQSCACSGNSAQRRVPASGRCCGPFVGAICDRSRGPQCRGYRARFVSFRTRGRRSHRNAERADGDAARPHHRTGGPTPLARDLFVRLLC